MNTGLPVWLARLLLGLSAFLASVAIVQTVIVLLVLVNGQDIQLKRWSIFQENYYEIRQEPTDHVRFEYHYVIDGQEFTRELLIKAYRTDDPLLAYWKMPTGHQNGIYHLTVWDKLPAYAIPSLPDYHPSRSVVFFCVASVIAFLGYRLLCMCTVMKTEPGAVC